MSKTLDCKDTSDVFELTQDPFELMEVGDLTLKCVDGFVIIGLTLCSADVDVEIREDLGLKAQEPRSVLRNHSDMDGVTGFLASVPAHLYMSVGVT
tara:strand:+ start:306 stop:593 length:288 start_codon:yes stop_codon:yes gene_type:complete